VRVIAHHSQEWPPAKFRVITKTWVEKKKFKRKLTNRNVIYMYDVICKTYLHVGAVICKYFVTKYFHVKQTILSLNKPKPTAPFFIKFMVNLMLRIHQPFKKFPAFYNTRMFITAFTTARHLSLSWARLIQSITFHIGTSKYILVLSYRLCLGLPNYLISAVLPSWTRYKLLVSVIKCQTRFPSLSPPPP